MTNAVIRASQTLDLSPSSRTLHTLQLRPHPQTPAQQGGRAQNSSILACSDLRIVGQRRNRIATRWGWLYMRSLAVKLHSDCVKITSSRKRSSRVCAPEDREVRRGRGSRTTYGRCLDYAGYPNQKAAPPPRLYLNAWNGFLQPGDHYPLVQTAMQRQMLMMTLVSYWTIPVCFPIPPEISDLPSREIFRVSDATWSAHGGIFQRVDC